MKETSKYMVKTKNNFKDEKQFSFSEIENKHISISVNGYELPLNIGDQIAFDDGEKIIKTVMKIQIAEDAKVLYCLEWTNGEEFKSDWMTMQEIWHMQRSKKKHNVSGFSA